MIFVKVVNGSSELQSYLNLIGWNKVLQVIPSECYKATPETMQVGAIRVPRGNVLKESTYTVIFEDDITPEELEAIQNHEGC